MDVQPQNESESGSAVSRFSVDGIVAEMVIEVDEETSPKDKYKGLRPLALKNRGINLNPTVTSEYKSYLPNEYSDKFNVTDPEEIHKEMDKNMSTLNSDSCDKNKTSNEGLISYDDNVKQITEENQTEISTGKLAEDSHAKQSKHLDGKELEIFKENIFSPEIPPEDSEKKLSETSELNQAEASELNQAEASELNQAETSEEKQAETSEEKQAETSEAKQAETSEKKQTEISEEKQVKSSEEKQANALEEKQANALEEKQADTPVDKESKALEEKQAKTLKEKRAKASKQKQDKGLKEKLAKDSKDKLAKESKEKLAKNSKEKLAKDLKEKLAKNAKEKLAKDSKEKLAKTFGDRKSKTVGDRKSKIVGDKQNKFSRVKRPNVSVQKKLAISIRKKTGTSKDGSMGVGVSVNKYDKRKQAIKLKNINYSKHKFEAKTKLGVQKKKGSKVKLASKIVRNKNIQLKRNYKTNVTKSFLAKAKLRVYSKDSKTILGTTVLKSGRKRKLDSSESKHDVPAKKLKSFVKDKNEKKPSERSTRSSSGKVSEIVKKEIPSKSYKNSNIQTSNIYEGIKSRRHSLQKSATKPVTPIPKLKSFNLYPKSSTRLDCFMEVKGQVTSADVKYLKILHRVLYDRSPPKDLDDLKNEILQFQGFTFNKRSDELSKRQLILKKLPDSSVLKICEILDIRKGSKDSMASDIIKFLLKPIKVVYSVVDPFESSMQPIVKLERISFDNQYTSNAINGTSVYDSKISLTDKRKRFPSTKLEEFVFGIHPFKRARISEPQKFVTKSVRGVEKKLDKVKNKRELNSRPTLKVKFNAKQKKKDNKIENIKEKGSPKKEDLGISEAHDEKPNISSIKRKGGKKRGVTIQKEVIKVNEAFENAKHTVTNMTDNCTEYMPVTEIKEEPENEPEIQNLPVLQEYFDTYEEEEEQVESTFNETERRVSGLGKIIQVQSLSEKVSKDNILNATDVVSNATDVVSNATDVVSNATMEQSISEEQSNEIVPDVVMEQSVSKEKTNEIIPDSTTNEIIPDSTMENSISKEQSNETAIEAVADVSSDIVISADEAKEEIKSSSSKKKKVIHKRSGIPLKCFPKIKQKITSANYSALQRLHILLFGASDKTENLKGNILAFGGFPFLEGSREWKQKEFLLSLLAQNTLKEYLNLLCLWYCDDDQRTLINKLMRFLAAPNDKMPEVRTRVVSSEPVNSPKSPKKGAIPKKKKPFNPTAPKNRKVLMDEAQARRLENDFAREQRILEREKRIAELKKTPVKYCAAMNCVNNSRDNLDISFFYFPTDPERLKKWTTNVILKSSLKKYNFQMCSAHFESNAFANNLKTHLLPDAVPTIQNPVNKSAAKYKSPPAPRATSLGKNVEDTSKLTLTEKLDRLKRKTLPSTQTMYPNDACQKKTSSLPETDSELVEALLQTVYRRRALKEAGAVISIPNKGIHTRLGELDNVKFLVVTANFNDLDVLHHLIYMSEANKARVRKNILDFAGFNFNEDSNPYKDRMHFLNSLGYDISKRIAFLLGLCPYKMDIPQQDLNELIMYFLMSPCKSKQVPIRHMPQNFFTKDMPKELSMLLQKHSNTTKETESNQHPLPTSKPDSVASISPSESPHPIPPPVSPLPGSSRPRAKKSFKSSLPSSSKEIISPSLPLPKTKKKMDVTSPVKRPFQLPSILAKSSSHAVAKLPPLKKTVLKSPIPVPNFVTSAPEEFLIQQQTPDGQQKTYKLIKLPAAYPLNTNLQTPSPQPQTLTVNTSIPGTLSPGIIMFKNNPTPGAVVNLAPTLPLNITQPVAIASSPLVSSSPLITSASTTSLSIKDVAPDVRDSNVPDMNDADDVVPEISRDNAPTDEDLYNSIQEIIHNSNFEDITLRNVIDRVSAQFAPYNLKGKHTFMKECVKKIIIGT